MKKGKFTGRIAARCVFLLTVCIYGLIGCGKEGKSDSTAIETTLETDREEFGEASEIDSGDDVSDNAADENRDAIRLCNQMTEAIERQFPGQTFTEASGEDMVVSPLLLGDSYLFSQRISSEGIHYAVGVRLTADSPLDGMTCGNGLEVPGFYFNQFDGGNILLIEKKNDITSDLSYLYPALQRGTEGVAYLVDAGKRGVSLVPPRDGSFLKVSMVKEGYQVTEFIPLTKEQAKELMDGETVADETGSGLRIALCDSRDELPSIWLLALQPPTVDMVELAMEKCGFDRYELLELKDITKATLSVERHGEKREETLQNREDLERLTKLLSGGVYGEARYDREYSGALTLTKADGSTVSIQLTTESGGFMLGNSVSCDLSGEETSQIWSLFTTLQGWLNYGNKIHMDMKASYYTADSLELDFLLSSEIEGEIHYSLSPVVYKLENSGSGDERWRRLDTIAGICGTFTPMKEERISLSVPWKDAYELKGPGTYKLEIQVMPAKDVRFEVSDTFELR